MRKVYPILMGLLCSTLLMAQSVGINNASPDASSALDVAGSDKGVLLPRVALVDVSDNTTPINNPATGLLVYNTNAAAIGGSGEGFYYFDGLQWTRFTTAALGNLDGDWAITGADIYNANSGNVGIGTTSPGNKLEITSVAADDGILIRSLSANMARGVYFNYGANSDATSGIQADRNEGGSDNGGMQLFATNGRPIQFYTAGGTATANSLNGTGEAMRITGSGNVGIGTASPSSLLDVTSGISGDAILTIRADTNNTNENHNPSIILEQDGGLVNGVISFEGNAGDNAVGTKPNAMFMGPLQSLSDLQFITYDTARVIIGVDGNVGIGTTSPANKLEIQTDTINNGLVIRSPRGDDARGVYFNYGSNTSNVSGIQADRDLGGSGQGGLQVIAANNRPIQFYTKGGQTGSGIYDTEEVMRINGSGGVGIGTNVINYNLGIHDKDNENTFVQYTHTGTGTSTGDGFLIGVNPNEEAVLLNRENTNMEFWTNNTQRMTIESGGHVGIGTTNPSATLDVVGTLQYVDGNQSKGNVLTSDNSGNASWEDPAESVFYYTKPINSTLNILGANWFTVQSTSFASVSDPITVSSGDLITINTSFVFEDIRSLNGLLGLGSLAAVSFRIVGVGSNGCPNIYSSNTGLRRFNDRALMSFNNILTTSCNGEYEFYLQVGVESVAGFIIPGASITEVKLDRITVIAERH